MTIRGEDPWRRKATMPLEKAATIRRELEPDLDTAAVAEKGPKKKPRQKKGGLLCRDIVGADHVAPKLDLALEQCTRGRGRQLVWRIWVHAALGKGLLRFRVGERSAQRAVELVDDRMRRAGRRQQHVPEIDVELFVAELAHGLELRQAGEPIPADDGVGLELTGPHQRPCDYSRYGAKIHLACQQIDECRTCAPIRHLRDLHAELLHDQHVGQMAKGADAGMPDLDVLSRLSHP